MIINIPLKVDDELLEGKMAQDVIDKVSEQLYSDIKRTLKDRGYSVNTDMYGFVMKVCEKYISENYKAEIIKETSKILADKLARSKKGKAIFEGLE